MPGTRNHQIGWLLGAPSNKFVGLSVARKRENRAGRSVRVDPGDGRYSLVCRPHSVLAEPLQRPARSSSPNITARVHGQQPMLV